jgi:hypothetical protein
MVWPGRVSCGAVDLMEDPMVEISNRSRQARLARRGHINRALTLAFFVGLCLAAGAGPALAQSRDTELSTDDQVILNGRAVVPAGETVGSVTIFNGPAVIEGTVRDSVVVFNGDTEIVGTVGREVVSFNGDVLIRSGAEVGGDLVTSTDPTIEQGATVRGSQQNVATRFDLEDFGLASRIAWWIGVTVSTIILGMVLLLFAPRAAESLEMVVRDRLGSSIAWGVGLLFLLPIVAIIALVTIVALPLGLALLAGLGLLFMIGYVAATFVVGRLILKPPQSPYLAFLVGWVILRLLALIPVVGGIVWILASAWGLGLLAAAARREGTLSRERVAETPPPTPSLP